MTAPPGLPAYLAPACAGRVALWRLAAGLALTAALYVVGLAMLAAAVAALGRPGPAWALIVALAGFAPLALGPLLAVRVLHRRPVGSVFGPAPRFCRDLVRSAWLAGLGLAAFSVLALPLGRPEAGLAPGRWAVLLVPALGAIAVQTLAEEVLFRGYLMAQLAARFPAARWLWLGGPALLFALLHLDRATFGSAAWAVVAVTALFGLIAADLTLRAGNLGPAWGLHFANNVLAVLVLGMPGPIDALALWVVPVAPGAGLLAHLAANAVALAAIWAILRRATGR
ncbi:MAG: CPBP family intramembrane metalloprotease [Rhodobacteraceae bacterium]|nr:CPBP family intramembrane metalloprotease [Paracoccaceae bacterium]